MVMAFGMDRAELGTYAPGRVNQLATNLRNFVRDLCGPWLVGTAIRSLREAAKNAETIEEAVSLAFGFRSCGIRIAPGQIPSEITQLLKVLAQNPPHRLLEIGTAGGGTFFLLSRVAADEALLISADLPMGQFGGGYPKWRGHLIQSFARATQRICLLTVDSHSPDTFREIQTILKSDLLDFLFIDGDHRYEGVKADFEMYSPLVRSGGLIGFHDIVPGPPEKVGGVAAFWQELKKKHQVREIVADRNQGGYGIGLLVKP
jgi:predicted O-methyltransferase YrrM